MTEDILLQVNKPARYIGREWNVAKKDFDSSNLRFALCFPDLYEVGMSNLGLRIIYGLLNSVLDVTCERFFAPAQDMESLLRGNHLEISSLESKRRLAEFDVIGFSLGYELSYTNVLNILDLGNIPLRSALRDESSPLVIGGGPCVLNPEPISEFFDLFVIGEAEDVLLEIVDIYRAYKGEVKESKISKQELLIALSKVEGVYVPSLYEVTYNTCGKIESFTPKASGVPLKVKKRIVNDLDKTFFPLDWLIPYIAIIHDRITLEIMRGCPNTCRFCQARSQYYPFRQRNLTNILNLAENVYRKSGYEEVSLCGLSVSDYPQIEELLRLLTDLFKKNAVNVSLPSIKPKTLVGNLSALIATIKKTGLTFAPEVGSPKLRKVLAKDFNTDEFFSAIEKAYLYGYQHIKLYFMLGLPFEQEEDLDSIIDFATEVSELRRKISASGGATGKRGYGPAQVNISINTLIPKPHTPFQWLGMENLENIKYKQDYLKKKTKNRRLKLSFSNRYMSFLEGVFSRGDRRLGQVILSAFKQGARFDAWGDHFCFDYWSRAFTESNIDPELYLKEKAQDEVLPWDILDMGISKGMLRKEFEKAIAI